MRITFENGSNCIDCFIHMKPCLSKKNVLSKWNHVYLKKKYYFFSPYALMNVMMIFSLPFSISVGMPTKCACVVRVICISGCSWAPKSFWTRNCSCLGHVYEENLLSYIAVIWLFWYLSFVLIFLDLILGLFNQSMLRFDFLFFSWTTFKTLFE